MIFYGVLWWIYLLMLSHVAHHSTWWSLKHLGERSLHYRTQNCYECHILLIKQRISDLKELNPRLKQNCCTSDLRLNHVTKFK